MLDVAENTSANKFRWFDFLGDAYDFSPGFLRFYLKSRNVPLHRVGRQFGLANPCNLNEGSGRFGYLQQAHIRFAFLIRPSVRGSVMFEFCADKPGAQELAILDQSGVW